MHLSFTDINTWMLINIGGTICPKRMMFAHGITVEFYKYINAKQYRIIRGHEIISS